MKINFIITAFLLFNITVFSQEKDFENYNQKIAGNDYGLEMISINGGVFKMGSPNYETNRMADEGPVLSLIHI